MIEIRDINKTFYDRSNKSKIVALNELSAIFTDNSFNIVYGKSGSGKSTLLNLIGLLDYPDVGEILFDGINLHKESKKIQARFRSNNIGFVFQSFHLEPTYDVYENIELPLLINNTKTCEIYTKIQKVLESVEMLERIHTMVNDLSGGEQQRIAIARALINNPRIILADEPCGNLDPVNSDIIMKKLKALSKDKIVIVVTHNDKYNQFADSIIKLSR